MSNEKSTLLSQGHKQQQQSNNNNNSHHQLSAGPLGDHGTEESFVNPRTTEQKIFVAFLILMILALVSLSCTVIFDSGADKRKTTYSDETAFGSIDALNSLYRRESTLEPGCESTLLLIRHCDKNTDADGVVHHGGNNYCSWLGRERSFFFASLFGNPDDPKRRYPAPAKIFALTEKRDSTLKKYAEGKSNYREIETVMPLASKFHLEIDVYNFDLQVLATDYFELLQSGDMCGKVTVVSWKHDIIPELAFALGCGAAEGCPVSYPDDSYDEVWQIKYVFDPKGKIKISPAPMDLPVETRAPVSMEVPNPADIPVPPANLDINPPVADEEVGDDEGDENDITDIADDINNNPRRLKHNKNKKHHKEKVKESEHHSKSTRIQKWSVYGSKTFQHFDPLHFSMTVGDYPSGGSPSGGKWAEGEL